HGKEMNDENQNIIVYQIKPEQLEYMGHVRDEKIVSPNDVIITAKGDFYITNDARDRGSLWDIYWRREISTVVFCNLEIDSEKISKKFCKVAAENLALPNSLAIQGNKMYVSTTRQNKIFEYDIEAGGELSNQRAVAEGVGFDNLSWSNIETGSGMLLTAEHASDWKFFRHVSSSENIAPSLVSMIDITTSEKKVLYANEGSEISAASGAIIFKNILYISQVFDDFILACKL
ncbi:MAG: SMP-30/gluconolactonase/LRE family protein, partial [Leptospiraceae bacterium]|nr:SMP-30/gluconolactonase/LRE family protein [Leptospiraceae bacterium]